MKLLRKLDEINLACGAVTIGNFDGVHHGHARIIHRLIALARAHDGPAVVFSFDPHPVRLLRPGQAPPPLTWTDRKAQLLAELGVDVLVAYPTNERLLQLTPGDFFQSIVRERLRAQALIEGPNFFFGHDRAGNIETLAQLCEQHNIRLEIVQPFVADGELISSSRVRAAITEGDVDTARQMLTQPYRLRGMVTHGAARGAQIGFPTANVDAIDTLVPGFGVYAGRAYTNGECYAAAIHIGPKPTFAESVPKVEVHLLNYVGQLYGQPLEVDFLSRLRDIQPFPDVAALTAQLRRDVAAAQAAQDTYAQKAPHAN